MSAWRKWLFSLLAAGGLALAATAVAGSEPVGFSHKLHVDSAGLECTVCHKQTPTKVELDTKSCSECHDPIPAWKMESKAKRLKIAFPHAAHAKAGACLDCHEAVLSDDAAGGKPMATFEDCSSCHRRKKVQVPEASCERCHGSDARKIVPEDHHGASWIERHGAEAEDRVFEKHGTDCKACHGQETCASCHRKTRPKSHTGLWRVRTHGSAASWDRDSCKTCHETSSCTRCHATTKPMNHNGSWRAMHGLAAGSSGNESCAVCHKPSYCASCHRQSGVAR
jgi:hypothetical protein